MSVYRQKYEDWFNALNEAERKAETARMNSSKTVKRQPANNAKNAANNASTTTTIAEPKFVNVPSNVTPAGPAFSITNLTPVVMQSGQQVQMQMQPQQAMPIQKDRQQLLDDILKREPVEPARSAKQLFVNEYLGKIHIFSKNYILNISIFTKFTISKSHFPQNSHFQSLIFHKIHIFQASNSW